LREAGPMVQTILVFLVGSIDTSQVLASQSDNPGQ
jgi:hypothetical protein